MFKYSTYKSLITHKRTMFIASSGKCGYPNYVEYQILLRDNQWAVYKTNGFDLDLVGYYNGDRGLKSLLNLIIGK